MRKRKSVVNHNQSSHSPDRLSRNGNPIVLLNDISQPSTSGSSRTVRASNSMSYSQPGPSRSSSNFGLQSSQKRTRASRSQSQVITELVHESEIIDEEGQVASSLVRYILAVDKGKKPITKAGIVKNVLAGKGREFQRVMTKAKNHLSQIFGYDLVELEGNKYILVNEVKNASSHIQFSEEECARKVLLFIVLTHIFMHEESSDEPILWDYLQSMGILNQQDNHHEYFGDVKQIITQEFVLQKYIDKRMVEKGDPPKFEYRWGPRAEHEFSRRAALEYVSRVYGNRSMNSWRGQYKSMIDKEKSRKQ